MKGLQYCFTLLLIGIILSSCKKNDLNYETSYEKSYKEWLSFKNTTGNSYRYLVTGATIFGPSWQTEIAVNNGKIVQRHFKFTTLVGMGNVPQESLEWTEDENEINSHKYFAASALTLDQIYDKAHSEWLLNRKNTAVYFETNNNGLISSCGYVEDGCMDDCFVGIRIAYIKTF